MLGGGLLLLEGQRTNIVNALLANQANHQTATTTSHQVSSSSSFSSFALPNIRRIYGGVSLGPEEDSKYEEEHSLLLTGRLQGMDMFEPFDLGTLVAKELPRWLPGPHPKTGNPSYVQKDVSSSMADDQIFLVVGHGYKKTPEEFMEFITGMSAGNMKTYYEARAEAYGSAWWQKLLNIKTNKVVDIPLLGRTPSRWRKYTGPVPAKKYENHNLDLFSGGTFVRSTSASYVTTLAPASVSPTQLSSSGSISWSVVIQKTKTNP